MVIDMYTQVGFSACMVSLMLSFYSVWRTRSAPCHEGPDPSDVIHKLTSTADGAAVITRRVHVQTQY